MYDETYSTWSSLHFYAGIGELEGTSCVNFNSCGAPFATGRDASWMPSLVPSVYRNTSPLARPSRGLSGELPIILALMGFHGRPGGASEVFLNHSWKSNRWHGSNRASTYRLCPLCSLLDILASLLMDSSSEIRRKSPWAPRPGLR